MKTLDVRSTTAVVELALYDLGIIADGLNAAISSSEPSPFPPSLNAQFRTDTEALYTKVTSLIAAMDDYAEEHPDDVPGT